MEGANSHGYQPAPKRLTVLYYNTRSMLPKLAIDELQASILFLKSDVICSVESWLSDDVTDNEISLPDYQTHRLDRNRHGGDIVLYAHNMQGIIARWPAQLGVSSPVNHIWAIY